LRKYSKTIEDFSIQFNLFYLSKKSDTVITKPVYTIRARELNKFNKFYLFLLIFKLIYELI